MYCGQQFTSLLFLQLFLRHVRCPQMPSLYSVVSAKFTDLLAKALHNLVRSYDVRLAILLTNSSTSGFII